MAAKGFNCSANAYIAGGLWWAGPEHAEPRCLSTCAADFWCCICSYRKHADPRMITDWMLGARARGWTWVRPCVRLDMGATVPLARRGAWGHHISRSRNSGTAGAMRSKARFCTMAGTAPRSTVFTKSSWCIEIDRGDRSKIHHGNASWQRAIRSRCSGTTSAVRSFSSG